jgi:hypothetical protein
MISFLTINTGVEIFSSTPKTYLGYCRPVPLQVGQTIFLLPPQVLQVLPLTLPLPLQTGQRIVFAPWHVAHVAMICSFRLGLLGKHIVCFPDIL